MNDADKKEYYLDYTEYMYDFYKQYNDDVGFDVLQNNIRTQIQNLKLNELKNINNFGIIMNIRKT